MTHYLPTLIGKVYAYGPGHRYRRLCEKPMLFKDREFIGHTVIVGKTVVELHTGAPSLLVYEEENTEHVFPLEHQHFVVHIPSDGPGSI